MTTPFLFSDLKRDEGCRLSAYLDTMEVPTIGYGHTGREVHIGLTWTQAECDAALEADVHATCQGLDSAIPWWTRLDDVRQDVIAELAFNIGVHALLGFKVTLAAVQAGDYANASAAMLISRWASQVGARATRLAAMMRTGQRPA
jgi:lysozyme